MEEKIKLKCITKYPEIEVLGIGKFKRNKEYDFPANIAEKLVVSSEWKRAKKIEFKPKRKEVKDV